MMTLLPNIQNLIDEGRIDEALDEITHYLDENSSEHDDDSGYLTRDEALFLRGKIYWRMQKYSLAVTDFEGAVALNPESGALSALELARDVFDYYNPDLLNP